MRLAHDDFKMGKIKTYPSSEFLINIGKISSCVQALRKNIDKGFMVQDYFSNLMHRRINI